MVFMINIYLKINVRIVFDCSNLNVKNVLLNGLEIFKVNNVNFSFVGFNCIIELNIIFGGI